MCCEESSSFEESCFPPSRWTPTGTRNELPGNLSGLRLALLGETERRKWTP